MMNNYKLTIIISNYNQEKHISETIDSVFNQAVDFPFKVIITDDCSTKDRSKAIIREYAKVHSNIETIFSEENGGYLTNILRAKARTKTKYFCLLDSDDYWTDRCYLQRAHDFLEAHDEYAIYEGNVEVVVDGQEDNRKLRHPYRSHRVKTGTYSKEMLLNGETVPITQTTGMFLRNCIFADGIPDVMRNAIGTRSERSFEGDTGRFVMHLKHGLAYYDSRIVGVYRLTENGIWNSIPESKKKIVMARMQLDYYQYYGAGSSVFVNKAYRCFRSFLSEKQRELEGSLKNLQFLDEEERLLAEDVYQFCREHKNEINRETNQLVNKVKRIYKILRW